MAEALALCTQRTGPWSRAAAPSPWLHLHTISTPQWPRLYLAISGLHLPWNRAGRGPRSSSNGARFPGMISPSRPSPTSFETALCFAVATAPTRPATLRAEGAPSLPGAQPRPPGGLGRRLSHLLERPRDADSQHQYCRSAGRSSTHAMAGWAQVCSSAASTSTAKASGRWPRKAPAWQRRARQPNRPRACPRLGAWRVAA